MNVRHSAQSLPILDEKVPLGRKFGVLEEDLDQVASAIIWSIIDDNQLVVLVILIKDGLQVVLVSIVSDIIPGGHNDAKGEFLFEATEMVLLLQPLNLFLNFFLHMSAFECVNIRCFEVDPAQCPRISYFLFLKIVFFPNFLKHLYFFHSDLFLWVRH